MEIIQERLKELLDYNSESGTFRWISGSKTGKIAGTKHCRGYWQICINRKCYLAHRLAWLYVYGKFPKTDIDHVNGVLADNRILNLRECSKTENMWNSCTPKNNTSGFKGVSWNKKAGRWAVRINIDKKRKNLGYFATAEQAGAVYKAKAKTIHRDFYREC